MQHRVAGIIAVVTLTIIVVPAAGWTPPLGIPTPQFGIDETHMMYVAQTYDFGAGPVPYPDAGNGPYTHYIEHTHPAATDSSNPYGTPGKPRKTVPWNLPAGSVAEIHGGPYSTPVPYTIYWTWFSGNGTAAKPVFIRGVDPNNRPVFQGLQLRAGGTYLIIENLTLNNTTISPKYFSADPDGLHHHISFRHLESYGIPPSFGTAVGVSRGHHIVIYDNHIHHNGDPEWPDENDLHGVTALAQAEHVWIVDNHIHHNGGDSIQINSVNAPLSLVAQYIYIGRNVMHDDGENAVDLKLCRDVIVSQNEMYGYVPSHFATSGSDGTAMVIHGDPVDVWVIYNHIYDSTNGVRCNGAVRAFILGNLIHNMHHDPIDPYDPGNVWSGGAGVITWATPELHVAGNTIYDVDAGFSSPSGGTQAHHVYNNIIANLAEPAHHIGVAGSGVAAASTMHHNVLYNPGGSARIKWASTSPVYNLTQFQTTFPGQGIGCTEGNPLLADPANGDLHITQGSPATSTASLSDFAFCTNLFFSLYGLSITVDYDGVPRPHGGGLDMGAYELTSTVVGRYVFYNNSTFDGDDPAANASDDLAIATDKTALLPGGTATFVNYTSYAKGINGIMLDIPDLPGTPAASDFELKVGNDNMPIGWAAAPAPSSITVRTGAGTGGSDRITIIWADNAIAKQWLQVTVLATANTGLGLPDVFYFGNAIGETGNSPSDAEVTPTDEVAVRDNPHTLGVNPATITDTCDFNRDRKVGPTDAIICRNNGTSSPTALKLISVP